jgi:hypothetical protein
MTTLTATVCELSTSLFDAIVGGSSVTAAASHGWWSDVGLVWHLILLDFLAPSRGGVVTSTRVEARRGSCASPSHTCDLFPGANSITAALRNHERTCLEERSAGDAGQLRRDRRRLVTVAMRTNKTT